MQHHRHRNKRYHDAHRQTRRGPCPVAGCPNKVEDRHPYCARHRKHAARTGSPIHQGLTPAERRPAARMLRQYIRRKFNQQDHATVGMVNEMQRVLSSLPSRLPKLSEWRGKSPLIKAQSVLAELDRQRWADTMHRRKRTPQTERTWVIKLLASCLSSELLAPSVCASVQYTQHQVCQGLFALLWLRKLQIYDVETGRGGTVRSIIYNHRPRSLQSLWVVVRLYELVSRCYLPWWQENKETIRQLIPAERYTRA